MLDEKRIGNFICHERQKLNLTQEELANTLFVTRQAVSKWERGKSLPDYDSLFAMCKLFKTSPNEILLGKKNKNSNNIFLIIITLLLIIIIVLIFIE